MIPAIAEHPAGWQDSRQNTFRSVVAAGQALIVTSTSQALVNLVGRSIVACCSHFGSFDFMRPECGTVEPTGAIREQCKNTGAGAKRGSLLIQARGGYGAPANSAIGAALYLLWLFHSFAGAETFAVSVDSSNAQNYPYIAGRTQMCPRDALS